MEPQETLERLVKAGLASMLLTLLLVVGGISMFGSATTTAPVTAFAPAPQAEQAANKPQEVAPTTAPQANTSQAQPAVGGVLDARKAVQVADPAVVTVINHLGSTNGGRFGQQVAPEASGSGVIIDKSGYIVTNNHVVEGAATVQVVLYNTSKQISATIVGTDAFSDLAVLKIDPSVVPAVATFGDSDALELGQPVVAIGSALGDYENSVTAGIVSGLHREIKDAGSTSLQDLIQTDAAINHGNSGGPLLDLNGNIVGINTAVVRSTGMSNDVAEGLGFAIPSNTVRQVVDQIIKNGSVSHPYIGISYQAINSQVAAYMSLPRDYGIYVSQVEPGSPADKAGIKANSIITAFDGTRLDDNTSLVQMLMKHKVGDTVKLSVLDEGASSEHDVSVTLAARPANK
jgi:serine protease Do